MEYGGYINDKARSGVSKDLHTHKEDYRLFNVNDLKEKTVCLTLDVEQDHGELLDEPAYEGFQHAGEFVDLFKELNIPLTCFVQGSLFESHPEVIEQLSGLDAEFELHSYSHPAPNKIDHEYEIEQGIHAFKGFFGKDPVGYRSPCGAISDEMFNILSRRRFGFDSSVFPSVRPGVFNNLTMPTVPFLLGDLSLTEFPITTASRVIRIPLSLSFFRLLGEPYLLVLKRISLPDLIVCNFHFHDIYSLRSSTSIPFDRLSPFYRTVFRRIYLGKSENRINLLESVIALFRGKGYRFSKLSDVYNLTCETVPV